LAKRDQRVLRYQGFTNSSGLSTYPTSNYNSSEVSVEECAPLCLDAASGEKMVK